MTVTRMQGPAPLALRPLAARSVVLSLLLGTHPPQLPVRELVTVAAYFDISETALRVSVSRMLAAGDLHRVDGNYALSDRLLARQARQDQAITPPARAWGGDWELIAITASSRSATDRAQQRTTLAELRLAELREGVWIRPANLQRTWPDQLEGLGQHFTARPETDAVMLAGTLWDLTGWAKTATGLLDYFTAATHPAERIAAAAAIVRHLLTDPVLPAPLLPAGNWPADTLRTAYTAYQHELIDHARYTLGHHNNPTHLGAPPTPGRNGDPR